MGCAFPAPTFPQRRGARIALRASRHLRCTGHDNRPMTIAAAHPLAPEHRAMTGRDLGWICGCLVFVMAPHAVRVPWWLTAFALCLFVCRAYLGIAQRSLPSRWL